MEAVSTRNAFLGAMNPAHYITGARLLLTPVFALIVGTNWLGDGWSTSLALAVAVLFELTDLADGYVARKTGNVTRLGKLLDPFADSVSRLTVFGCLAFRHTIGIGFFLVLLYRDSLIAMTRTFCGLNGVVLSARISGKIKAWCQALGLLTILGVCAYNRSWDNRPLFFYVMLAVTAVTVLSAVDYLRIHGRVFLREE